ncbi:hypothetical protein TVNIR_0905 [Thioalkalivibrio nitratireducens DSM 14787]|uniref:DUF1795 domain-containing protein n=1 Tax=Thioalkalivibrio nitratireducens (strain DSM 14787 / UNIQEM 213 / ALEN2) TaxID=1255043 RepID=L0DUC1_THIND|nr:hypothetical protein [Thioalkalivibrio nitratireducens]AGA32595.1 hypothetical protein TVNIR_0905 [Thioalkalivibrio nitratireducens DSM 14787]
MAIPLLPSTSRVLNILAAVVLLFAGTTAQGGEATYADPAGHFTLAHPDDWKVAGSPGEVELYGDRIASSMRFIVHPLEGLPTHDPDTLIELMLEGMLTTYRDVERTGPKTATLAGQTMTLIQFQGMSTRPITVAREGALYLTTTGTHLVAADYSIPQAAAAEILPQVEAVLESFTLADGNPGL